MKKGDEGLCRPTPTKGLYYTIISLLLRSTSLSGPFSLFGMGRLRATHYTNENGVTTWKIDTYDLLSILWIFENIPNNARLAHYCMLSPLFRSPLFTLTLLTFILVEELQQVTVQVTVPPMVVSAMEWIVELIVDMDMSVVDVGLQGGL